MRRCSLKCVCLGSLLLLCTLFILHLNTLITSGRRRKVLEDSVFRRNKSLPYDDPLVLDYIRNFHIHPRPSGPYKLTKKILPLHNTIGEVLEETLGNIDGENTDLFFIEAGAHDGEFQSNTLDLEVNFGWRGLLVEASPTFFSALKERHRWHSWHSDVCLSPRPVQLEMFRNTAGNPAGSRLKFEGKTPLKVKNHVSEGKVDCFPLASVLTAMNVSRVDFLSLDIEGNEYKVLDAFPFDKIDIKVIQVEWLHVPEGRDALSSLLIGKGYEEREAPDPSADFLFVKTNFLPLAE